MKRSTLIFALEILMLPWLMFTVYCVKSMHPVLLRWFWSVTRRFSCYRQPLFLLLKCIRTDYFLKFICICMRLFIYVCSCIHLFFYIRRHSIDNEAQCNQCVDSISEKERERRTQIVNEEERERDRFKTCQSGFLLSQTRLYYVLM